MATPQSPTQRDTVQKPQRSTEQQAPGRLQKRDHDDDQIAPSPVEYEADERQGGEAGETENMNASTAQETERNQARGNGSGRAGASV